MKRLLCRFRHAWTFTTWVNGPGPTTIRCRRCDEGGRGAMTDDDHAVEHVEYVPVCAVCWKPVHRNENDDGWVHE